MHLLIHHALYDAFSLKSMLDDLSSILSGQKCSAEVNIKPALRHILQQSVHGQNDAELFWRSKASEAVVNSFPVMTPLREDTRQILTYETNSTLPFSKLQALSAKLGVSIQSVIQAAWTRVLASYIGEDSVVFGVTLSGRTTDETRTAPFPCLVTVPIIASSQQSNADLVQYMAGINKNIFKHQSVPLRKIQKWLGHPGSPVFDTLVAFQKREELGATEQPWRLVRDEAVVSIPSPSRLNLLPMMRCDFASPTSVM